MKLSFDLLTALITYCKKPQSMVNIEENFRWEHGLTQIKAVISYAIKQKLIIKAPHQVKNGSKRPSTWVAQPSFTKSSSTGARNV